MNIEITARHFTPSEDLKAFVNEKVPKLLKYDPRINFIKVVLLKESRAEKVELIVNSKNKQYIRFKIKLLNKKRWIPINF